MTTCIEKQNTGAVIDNVQSCVSHTQRRLHASLPHLNISNKIKKL